MGLKGSNGFRLAVFSDIHGNAEALETVLQDIKYRGKADMMVAAGDLLTEGPFPLETYNLLREYDVHFLLGNHDDYLLDRGFEHLERHDWHLPEKIRASNGWTREQLGPAPLEYLAEQPYSLRFGPDGLLEQSVNYQEELLVTHATPRSCHDRVITPETDPQNDLHYNESFLREQTPVVAFGHFHQSYVLDMPDGRRLVNVASVSMPYDKSRQASYSLFHWSGPQKGWHITQHRVNYRWEVTARAMEQCDMPEKDFMVNYFT